MINDVYSSVDVTYYSIKGFDFLWPTFYRTISNKALPLSDQHPSAYIERPAYTRPRAGDYIVARSGDRTLSNIVKFNMNTFLDEVENL